MDEVHLVELLDDSIIMSIIGEEVNNDSVSRIKEREETLACTELDLGEIQVLFE